MVIAVALVGGDVLSRRLLVDFVNGDAMPAAVDDEGHRPALEDRDVLGVQKMRRDVVRAARNTGPWRLRLMHRELHRGVVNGSDLVLVAVLCADGRSDRGGAHQRRGSRY